MYYIKSENKVIHEVIYINIICKVIHTLNKVIYIYIYIYVYMII